MSKQFVPEDGDLASCPSTWQSNRSCQDGSAQTAELSYVGQETQSKFSSSVETQTDSVDGSKVPNVDLNKLASWLTRITPKVLEELDKNSKSRAFDDYKLLETSDCSIKHLYDLNFDKETAHSKFVTSGIDWSSTGGMIAVSRCCKEHPSWCDHTGCVLLHKTYRNESSTGSPRFSLDVSACVTTLCAHPSDSFIISCGTYSGEINVWNLQRDEPIVVGSVTLHTESVVHMEWVQNFDVTQTRPVLVSASRDGSVVIWAMKTVTGTLRPIQCFLLQDVKDNLDFGIACAKFNPSKPSLFIAGLEGGSIAICSSERRYPCNQRQATFFKDLDCCNPVLKVLDGHKGAVTGVQWIPENKELFISCGTDSELRVYSISEVNLVRIIHLPELSSGLEVCTSHPNIAILYGLSGTVHLLNVLNGKQLHPLDIASDGVPLSTIRLRTTSSLLLALGNAEGKVSVWQIPHSKFIDVNGM